MRRSKYCRLAGAIIPAGSRLSTPFGNTPRRPSCDGAAGARRQEFVNSPHFVWNSERVTFVPQYAKLAPSAGACYAEKMRRTAFAPARFKEQLRKGLNQLTYNIDNLFFFLPCSFLVPVHNG